ncbi:MAG: response regulator [Mariprofundaceae bacterium]|nr:response regulator [Mariprofundaceae bacterium]
MNDKILVLDDEDFIREEVVECLNDQGYQCVEAACALEALDILHADNDVAIALVDIRMPSMSGLEMIT